MENMSIYIPRVFANIGEKKISDVFESNNIGKVNRVDLVTKIGKDNRIYHSAYVHFEEWYTNIASRNIQEKLNADKEVKIVYDDPWYWTAYKNKTKKFGGNGQRKERLVIEKDVIVTEKKALEEDQEFTQEELDEIERNILEEFAMEVELSDYNPECFEVVDARYAAILEKNLTYYENLSKTLQEKLYFYENKLELLVR